MKSKVFFVPVTAEEKNENVSAKLGRLLKQGKVLDCVGAQDSVAIKLHFGEEGNTGFVNPSYVKVICDQVKAKQAVPFVSDTNTLYQGRRTHSEEHLKLASEHGFTPERLGTKVVIPDDRQGKNTTDVTINQKFIKIAKITTAFVEADALVSVAHFKGHIMTGFGGVLKNVGMGCASREGKLAQHAGVAPVVIKKKCTGCEACVKVCPVFAIVMQNKVSHIDSKKCIGCASCIAACHFYALDVPWAVGAANIQHKIIEYAKAVLQSKKTKSAFINFATKITKECDCLAKDDPRIVPDIGIFASTDPVAVDKAAFDMVNEVAGKDIFREAHPDRDGMKQLTYAAQLGLGNLEYDLIEIK